MGLGDRRGSVPARPSRSPPSSRSGRTSCRPSRSSPCARACRAGDQRPVPAAIEHHVLPDLVADRDGVVRDAELGQQRQVLVGRRLRRRIDRIVEQHQPWCAALNAARPAPRAVKRQFGGDSRTSLACRRPGGSAAGRLSYIGSNSTHLVARLDQAEQAAARASVAPEVTVISLAQSTSSPWERGRARPWPGAAPGSRSSAGTGCSR